MYLYTQEKSYFQFFFMSNISLEKHLQFHSNDLVTYILMQNCYIPLQIRDKN